MSSLNRPHEMTLTTAERGPYPIMISAMLPHQIFPLALVETLRQFFGVEHPGPAALEEAVILGEDRGDHTTRDAAHNVHLRQQGDKLDALAVVLHDLAHDVECRELLFLRPFLQGQQLVDPVAAD